MSTTAHQGSGPTRRPLVYVVDDEPAIRRYLQAVLDAMGADTHVFSAAEPAVAAVRGARPDVVLLDWLMPGLSGSAAVDALREAGAALIVICSALVPLDEADFLRTSGADEFMAKPCRVEHVEHHLARWMQNGGQR